MTRDEEFVDFECAARQFCPEWGIPELDEEALGIVDKTTSTCVKPAAATPTTGARRTNDPTPPTTPALLRDGMKVSVLDNGDSDDNIFGTTHNYGSSFCSGGGIVAKARPTMISAKYRLKEERRKVLKISINKLKKIEDPESSLRRSVLINNTMKRLQKEAKEEKLQKQQVHSYPRCYTPSGFSRDTPCEDGGVSGTTRSSEASALNDANKENTSPFAQTLEKRNNNCLLKNEITKSEVFLMPEDCLCPDSIDELVDATGVEARARLIPSPTCSETYPSSPPVTCSDSAFASSKKRPFDEVEDCDVHDVLSQFYMPPTPRMLTSIDDTDDEDEDVNVVDVDTSPLQPVPVSDCKRPRLDSSGERESCLTESVLAEVDKVLDECDDIEVVLEDKEDIERRLLLCSGGTRTPPVSSDPCWVDPRTPVNPDPSWIDPRTSVSSDPCRVDPRTPVSPDPSWVNVRTPVNSDPRWTPVLPSTPSCDMPVLEEQPQPNLRFGFRDRVHPYSANSGGSPMILDTPEQHQYSCGHSSMFGELQSVVFHSLVASLES